MAAMGHAGHDQLAVFLGRHAGQLFKKSDRGPDLLIGMVGPGRHAGHLDAVLDDPEDFGF